MTFKIVTKPWFWITIWDRQVCRYSKKIVFSEFAMSWNVMKHKITSSSMPFHYKYFLSTKDNQVVSVPEWIRTFDLALIICFHKNFFIWSLIFSFFSHLRNCRSQLKVCLHFSTSSWFVIFLNRADLNEMGSMSKLLFFRECLSTK